MLLELTVKTRGKGGWNEEVIELRKKRGEEIVLALKLLKLVFSQIENKNKKGNPVFYDFVCAIRVTKFTRDPLTLIRDR